MRMALLDAAAALLFFTPSPAGWARSVVVPGVQDVAFTAACDGTQQHYMLLLPRDFKPNTQHDVLIALHGQGSDRHQFMQPSRGETRATLDGAAAHGLILVTPDYRAPASWMGPNAESDLTQIIGELKSRYRIRHLILSGASMGGTGALTYTALHPGLVDAVVAMNGTANLLEYDNYQPAINASFGGTKEHIPAEYWRRSAEYWPGRFTMPVALTTGGRDTTVPPDSVLRFAAILHNLKVPVFLMHRPDGGHETNVADARAALEFALQALAGTGR